VNRLLITRRTTLVGTLLTAAGALRLPAAAAAGASRSMSAMSVPNNVTVIDGNQFLSPRDIPGRQAAARDSLQPGRKARLCRGQRHAG